VQQRIRHRVAAGDRLIAAAKWDRHLAEGAGFLGFRGNLIEDQTPGLTDIRAAFDQILGKTALEVQATCQIVDCGHAIPLALACAGRDSFGIGCDEGVGLLSLRLGAGFVCGDLCIRRGRFRIGHGGFLGCIGVAGLVSGHCGRGVGFVRHRDGSCVCGWDVPAVKDASCKVGLGAEACGGVGANGHGGHLEGSPVHRAPKLAGSIGFGDLEAVNLVADGDRTDVSRLNVAPDRFDIGALRNPNLRNAPAVFDARRTRHDRANHSVERVDLMHLQERRARIKPIQPHMGRIEAELFVIRLAEQGRPANARPR